VTYRLGQHTTVDDPTKYRSDEEVREWEKKDPLIRLQRHLAHRNLLDESGLAALDAELDESVSNSVKAAFQRARELGGVGTLFEHVFADPPAELRRQREQAEISTAVSQRQQKAKAGANGKQRARAEAD
jgi:TPP-dependent pyruvate/acetoin dehydrogenase alpha subunit